jgi:3-phosphoinositide dependent protein kinase-1
VVKVSYSFPDNFNEIARDLIENLVINEPSKRLGANRYENRGYDELKKHKFFGNINWNKLSEQTPPV